VNARRYKGKGNVEKDYSSKPWDSMTIAENEAWKAKHCLMEIYLEKSQREIEAVEEVVREKR
jgi:hypothetical protein